MAFVFSAYTAIRRNRVRSNCPLPTPFRAQKQQPFIRCILPNTQAIGASDVPDSNDPILHSGSIANATAKSVEKQMSIWRLRVFLAMLLGYSIYYLGRSTFVFSAPVMQRSLSLSLTDIGIITSVFPTVYGIAKLFGGVIADVNSPRIVFSGGLIAIGLCNVLFGIGSNSVPYFALLWGLNGIVSSIGFPACARLLSTWFSSTERGLYWGILNVSLNVGGFMSPLIIGSIASKAGWRYGMMLPAALAVATGLVTYLAIRDSPAHAGLALSQQPMSANSFKPDGNESAEAEGLMGKLANAVAVFRRQLLQGVLTVPPVWNLAIAYHFVYIIRQALTSWTVFYLMEFKGVTSLAEAALRVSGLELGGLFGSISSGWLSDQFIKRNPEAGAVGQRIQVALLYVCMTAFALVAFYFTPITPALLPLQWLVFAWLGACLYGPQLLVGLSGAECVAPTCSGTSNGFLGTSAYLGAALAGLPLTFVVRRLGWDTFFVVLIACCVFTAVAILPLTRLPSFEQKQSNSVK